MLVSWHAFRLDRGRDPTARLGAAERSAPAVRLPQLTYLVVIQSVVTALIGSRLRRQRRDRRGMGTPPGLAAPLTAPPQRSARELGAARGA
jgi:hypothetical protein